MSDGVGFGQAALWLEQGKKIRRRSWGNSEIYIEKFCQQIRYRDKNTFIIDMYDLKARDWELYVNVLKDVAEEKNGS